MVGAWVVKGEGCSARTLCRSMLLCFDTGYIPTCMFSVLARPPLPLRMSIGYSCIRWSSLCLGEGHGASRVQPFLALRQRERSTKRQVLRRPLER